MAPVLSTLGRRRVPLALLAVSALLLPVEIADAGSRNGGRGGGGKSSVSRGSGGSRASSSRSSGRSFGRSASRSSRSSGRSSFGSSRSSGRSFGSSRSSGRSSYGSSGRSSYGSSRSSYGSSRPSYGSSRSSYGSSRSSSYGSSRSSYGSSRSSYGSSRSSYGSSRSSYGSSRSGSSSTTPSRVPYRLESSRSTASPSLRSSGSRRTITPSTLGPSMTLDRFSRSSGTRAPATTRRSTSSLAPSRLDSSSRTRRVGGTESRLADTSAARGRLADSSYRARSSTLESRLADRNATARARNITEADLQRSRTLGTNERSRDALREAFRNERPPAEAAPAHRGKDFDDYDDHDWDDYWDDYWDEYWDEYFDNYEDFVEDNWWWGLFTPFWSYPYYHHHYFGWNYPYCNSYWWFHFHFGYYPIYSSYVYPYYVSYQPVYVPTYSSAVVYQPVYVEPATIETAPAPAVDQVPPYLAEQLNELAGNETAVTWLESGARKFKAGQFESAADAFRRAMLLEPKNAVPKFALGHSLFALGDYTNAAFMLRRGMQILPQWPTVGTSLHELYGNPDDLAEQTIALRVFLDAQPDDGDARFLLGYVSYFSGDLDAADAAFQSVAATNPTSVETQAFLARIAEVRAALPPDVVEVPTPSGG